MTRALAEHTSYLSNRMNNLRRQTEMFVFKSTMKLRNYCMCSCTWICNEVRMITSQFLQFFRCFAASVAYMLYCTIHILYSTVQQWFYISQPPWLDPPPPLSKHISRQSCPCYTENRQIKREGGSLCHWLSWRKGEWGGGSNKTTPKNSRPLPIF